MFKQAGERPAFAHPDGTIAVLDQTSAIFHCTIARLAAAHTFLMAEISRHALTDLSVQGRWLEWTDAMHSDLSWRRLIHGLDDGELQFNLRAISNTLPTPDNLRRWGQNEVDPACPLCGRPASLRHILNSCSVALHQGRYTWRHDSVLEVLQRHLTSFWKHVKSEPLQDQAPFIRLVKEGAPACLANGVMFDLSSLMTFCAVLATGSFYSMLVQATLFSLRRSRLPDRDRTLSSFPSPFGSSFLLN